MLKINTFDNRRSSISELCFKSLSDRNPHVMQIAHPRSRLHLQKHVNSLIVVDVLASRSKVLIVGQVLFARL